MRPRILILALSLFAIALPAHASEEYVKLGGLNVRVWTPNTPAGVKSPVIIFSHGFHDCATQSEFLTQALAQDGYIVFAPNHFDAICAGKGNWLDPSVLMFGQPDQWNDQAFRERGEDIRKLIAALKTDSRFRDRIDWDHFGLAGHSLGGYTVLGLGGAWPSWKIPGVKAVLAMSAYTQPFVMQHTLHGLSVPVMYQGGTNDMGLTPAMRNPGGAYDQSPAPKYYVEFTQAGHLAWTNMNTDFHDIINVYGLAFLDHYVKGTPADPTLMRQSPGTSLLEYDSELGANAPIAAAP